MRSGTFGEPFSQTQHGALGGEPLVANVGRHAGAVAGPLPDHRLRSPGRPVLDVPNDFVRQRDEPFATIVAVLDGQDVLLRRRTEEAVLDDRANGRIPGHVRPREVGEKVERRHFVFKSGLGIDFRRAVTRVRPTALSLSPFFTPQGAPVSIGAANGSYPSIVQSDTICLKMSI